MSAAIESLVEQFESRKVSRRLGAKLVSRPGFDIHRPQVGPHGCQG